LQITKLLLQIESFEPSVSLVMFGLPAIGMCNDAG